MIRSNEPVIIMTQAELDSTIQQAARAAVAEALKHAPKSNSPRPADVTQTQAAKMLNKSRPTIRRLIDAGTLRLNKCGNIPIEMIDEALRAA